MTGPMHMYETMESIASFFNSVVGFKTEVWATDKTHPDAIAGVVIDTPWGSVDVHPDVGDITAYFRTFDIGTPEYGSEVSIACFILGALVGVNSDTNVRYEPRTAQVYSEIDPGKVLGEWDALVHQESNLKRFQRLMTLRALLESPRHSPVPA